MYLVFYETTINVKEAIARERQIKERLRKRKMALIKSVNPYWEDLAADWDLEYRISNPLELPLYVMLTPFDLASHSLRSGTSPHQLRGTSQAKFREASSSWNRRVLLAWNEILRRSASQNGINWEPFILFVSKPLTL
jgi:hypothetical protein